MAEEYIRKQDAISIICEWGTEIERLGKYTVTASEFKQYAADMLSGLQPADVAPVVVGHWDYVRHYGQRYRKCSICSAEKKDDRSTGWYFCPVCGAKMDKGEG